MDLLPAVLEPAGMSPRIHLLRVIAPYGGFFPCIQWPLLSLGSVPTGLAVLFLTELCKEYDQHEVSDHKKSPCHISPFGCLPRALPRVFLCCAGWKKRIPKGLQAQLLGSTVPMLQRRSGQPVLPRDLSALWVSVYVQRTAHHRLDEGMPAYLTNVRILLLCKG